VNNNVGTSRAMTSCKKKVYSLLYRPNTTTKEMTYGIEMERQARKKYEELYGVSVEACGLFADIEFTICLIAT